MLFNLREEGPDALDLDIFEDIGRGSFFSSALSAQQVRNRLRARGDAKVIRVTINSNGGEVTEGLSIYEDLVAHKARVEVKIQGLAASIASVIAMAGDDIAIAPTGFLMMHGVSGGARGDADFLEDTASLMRKAQSVIASVYAKRSKQPTEKVAAWLSRETYMTAEEALANGLVDRIDDKIATPTNQAKAFAMFNSASLDGAPAALLDAIRGAQAEPPPTAPLEPTPAPALPVAQNPTPEPPERTAMTTPTTSDATPAVARALGLPAGATETDIVARATTLRELELQAFAMTGVQVSSEATGALRGIKAKADRFETVETELAQVKAERDQQNFDALIMRGTSTPVKLSLATAKLHEAEFLAAKADGRGAEVVARLKGFLDVAPPIIAERKTPAVNSATGSGGARPTYNNKTYAEMKPAERARLSSEEPELFKAMRQDHQEQARA